MTGARRGRMLVAFAGLVIALGLAVQVLGTDAPSTPAQAAKPLPPPCSSCDARHARLRAGPIDVLETKE
jgi:hypothetical protein